MRDAFRCILGITVSYGVLMVQIHTDKISPLLLLQCVSPQQRASDSRRRGGSMEGFRSSCRRRPRAGDSLRFSHIILTKCHEGLEANKRQRNKRGCCCKAFIEGRRKGRYKTTVDYSTPTPHPSSATPHPPSPPSPDLQRGERGRADQRL